MAEHIVKTLLSRYGAQAFCQTCRWIGPMHWERGDPQTQASVDATAHAAQAQEPQRAK